MRVSAFFRLLRGPIACGRFPVDGLGFPVEDLVGIRPQDAGFAIFEEDEIPGQVEQGRHVACGESAFLPHSENKGRIHSSSDDLSIVTHSHRHQRVSPFQSLKGLEKGRVQVPVFLESQGQEIGNDFGVGF